MKRLLLFVFIFISLKNCTLAQDHWLHMPSPYYMNSISQADSNHLVVAGGNDQKIFKSDDSGDSFKEIYTLETGAITDIAHPTPAIMLAIVDSVRNIKIQENPVKYQTLYASYILRSNDSGKTWTPTYFSQTGGADARVFRQIIMSDKNNGIISQQWADTNRVDKLSPVLLTEDGGISWKDGDFTANDFLIKRSYLYDTDVKLISSPRPGVWFVGGYNYVKDKNELRVTSDFGKTWFSTDFPMQFLKKFHFVNDSVGYAIGGKGGGIQVISRTTNSGKSWIHQEFPYTSYPRWNFNDIDFCDDANGLIAEEGGILRTTDSGKTWSEEYVGITDSLRYQGDYLRLISYFNRNHAVGIARMQTAIRYIPEGIAEQPQMTTPKIIMPTGARIDEFQVPGRVWWHTTPGAVKYYIEIYDNWGPYGKQIISDSSTTNSMYIDNLSEPFFGSVRVRAVTANSLSNWSVPVPFSVKNAVSVQNEINNSYIQPYPNPANNIIYIPFKTTNESEISVMICDALGKSINTFKSSYSLSHNAIMLSDLEQLPNGIYFVQISQGNQQQTSMITISK